MATSKQRKSSTPNMKMYFSPEPTRGLTVEKQDNFVIPLLNNNRRPENPDDAPLLRISNIPAHLD